MSLPFDFPPPAPPPKPEIVVLKVGELARVIRARIDEAFYEAVWVEGEAVGVRPASSGHLYFTLKDEDEEAIVDVVVYRSSVTPRMKKLVVDGARVRMRGKPTYWAPRGRMQFVADRVAPAGKGALLEALEKLKEKLAAEGLFAAERKRPLPKEPRILGVVTSAQGAVIHDICKVAFRRGGARILLAPAVVQGAGAADSIRRALQTLTRVVGVDVVIVGRGGGSAEELSVFNDEALVRAVAACPVPVVSAVGHEVDVTLTDFVADARAATPSQAAEMIVPDARARFELLRERKARLVRAMRARLSEDRVVLTRLERKMSDPRLAIASWQQLLDDRRARMESCMHRTLQRHQGGHRRLEARLGVQHPRARLVREHAELVRLFAALRTVFQRELASRSGEAHALSGRLDAMSPLKVLGRGYSIATRSDGHALRRYDDVKKGDKVMLRLAVGTVVAKVTSLEGEQPAQLSLDLVPSKAKP